MSTLTRLTLDEFLALDETEPLQEFLAGEILERPNGGDRSTARSSSN